MDFSHSSWKSSLGYLCKGQIGRSGPVCMDFLKILAYTCFSRLYSLRDRIQIALKYVSFMNGKFIWRISALIPNNSYDTSQLDLLCLK